MLCELWSEKFEWFGPSPIEPFNQVHDRGVARRFLRPARGVGVGVGDGAAEVDAREVARGLRDARDLPRCCSRLDSMSV